MARLPDLETEQSKATMILRAMGNSKRLRILNELADGQERSVSELEEIISTLSQPSSGGDGQISYAHAVPHKPSIIQQRMLMFCVFYVCLHIST